MQDIALDIFPPQLPNLAAVGSVAAATTVVDVDDFPSAARPPAARKGATAFTAEKLAGKQVNLPDIGCLVQPAFFLKPCMGSLELLLGDNGRNAILNADDILIGLVTVGVAFAVNALTDAAIKDINAGVLLIINNVVHGVFPEQISPPGAIPQAVQIIGNDIITMPCGVHIEDRANNDRLCLVNPILLGDRIDRVAQGRPSTCVLAFESSFLHALIDLPGQVLAIVFRHGLKHRLQDDALGRFLIQILLHTDEGYAVFLEFHAIADAVAAFPRKAIKLVHQHDVKGVVFGCLNHFEETGSFIGCSRARPVYVLPDNEDPLSAGIFGNCPHLGIYGFIPLIL